MKKYFEYKVNRTFRTNIVWVSLPFYLTVKLQINTNPVTIIVTVADLKYCT